MPADDRMAFSFSASMIPPLPWDDGFYSGVLRIREKTFDNDTTLTRPCPDNVGLGKQRDWTFCSATTVAALELQTELLLDDPYAYERA